MAETRSQTILKEAVFRETAKALGLRVKKVHRRISWEEFDERWWKGLYMFCDEQETPDHHLQHKNSGIMMINCDEEQLPVIYHETDLGTVKIDENLLHKAILEEESSPQAQVPILNLEHGLRFHKASLDVCKDSHSVLEAIGKLHVSKKSQPLKRTKLNDDGASLKETIDVNGFQVLPS